MRTRIPNLWVALVVGGALASPALAASGEKHSSQERIRALEIENQALREELARRNPMSDGSESTDPNPPPSREAPADEIDADFSFSFHRDTRSFSTLGVVTSIRNLPFGLSIWGFTDLHGTQSGDRWIDVTTSFSEYRLSKALPFFEGVGLQAEVNDGSRAADSLARFGLTYRHPLSLSQLGLEAEPGWLQWRVFPVDTTGDAAQLSWIYHLPLTERLSFGGFADYNLREGPNRWVIEPELRYRVWKNWSLLLEYRYNEFESAAPGLRGRGLAFGFRAAL